MRKIVMMILVAAMLLPLAMPLAQAQTVIQLPRGTWVLAGDGSWRFLIAEDTELIEEQRKAAEAAAVEVVDDKLPEGVSLSEAQIEALYPDAGEYFAKPEAIMEPVNTVDVMPEGVSLEMFSLDGEWFYGEDDALYYAPKDSGMVMTQEQVFRALQGKPAAEEKIIYLTIDDCPSDYTMEMLSMLDSLDVKATFFVVGAFVKRSPVFLRAMYEQGHVIANHSYSHNESTLKRSAESALADFKRTEEEVEKALGFPLAMPIIRIPYGSGILPLSTKQALQDAGYLWIDWNALNGDTEDAITSDKLALERAFSTASRYDGSIVLLVHEGKKRTIRTMPELVKHFREQGYTFRVLTEDIEKIEGVRMGFPSK